MQNDEGGGGAPQASYPEYFDFQSTEITRQWLTKINIFTLYQKA